MSSQSAAPLATAHPCVWRSAQALAPYASRAHDQGDPAAYSLKASDLPPEVVRAICGGRLPSLWASNEPFKARPLTAFPISMVDAGGLFAYGTSLRDAARHMARYADSILKGSKPGDLPIEAARNHALVVNQRVARHLGVECTPQLLQRANQVIE